MRPSHSLACLLLAALGACGDGTGPCESTGLHIVGLRFAGPPTAVDQAAARGIAGCSRPLLTFEDVFWLETTADLAVFTQVAGVQASQDYGPAEDSLPVIVVAHTATAPVAADTSFLRSIGGSGHFFTSSQAVLAYVPLSQVPQLTTWPRFVGFEVDIATSVLTAHNRRPPPGAAPARSN